MGDYFDDFLSNLRKLISNLNDQIRIDSRNCHTNNLTNFLNNQSVLFIQVLDQYGKKGKDQEIRAILRGLVRAIQQTSNHLGRSSFPSEKINWPEEAHTRITEKVNNLKKTLKEKDIYDSFLEEINEQHGKISNKSINGIKLDNHYYNVFLNQLKNDLVELKSRYNSDENISQYNAVHERLLVLLNDCIAKIITLQDDVPHGGDADHILGLVYRYLDELKVELPILLSRKENNQPILQTQLRRIDLFHRSIRTNIQHMKRILNDHETMTERVMHIFS
jgi:hypothetical protein